MIFPGFPGVLSFFQVFQVEWEPCVFEIIKFYLQEFVKNSSEALKNLEKNRAAKEHPNEGTELQESTPKKKYWYIWSSLYLLFIHS